MNLNDLNQWIGTDEGAAWLEGQKKPLLDKRSELLEALRQANGKAAEQAQRAADLEKILGEERRATEKTVVDGQLARLLKDRRVIEAAIPGLVSELKEAYGLAVAANGTDRKAAGKMRGADGAETEIDLEGAVSAWAATDAAKSLILVPGSSGGGSMGPGPARPAYTREAISRMDPREVAAKLDDPAFRSAIESLSQGA